MKNQRFSAKFSRLVVYEKIRFFRKLSVFVLTKNVWAIIILLLLYLENQTMSTVTFFWKSRIQKESHLYKVFFFYSCFPPVWQLALYISPTFFPFSPPPFLYRQSYPPWECDRSHSLLCCVAFARGHWETAEDPCRYIRPFNRVCPQSNSLWKMTSCSAFRCAGRGPAVTHPSTDPAWLGWSPSTGRLPHTEHCRYLYKVFMSVACSACSGSSPNISEYCRTSSEIPEDVATAKPVRQTFHLFSIYKAEENRTGIFYYSFNKCT